MDGVTISELEIAEYIIDNAEEIKKDFDRLWLLYFDSVNLDLFSYRESLFKYIIQVTSFDLNLSYNDTLFLDDEYIIILLSEQLKKEQM